jgi:hypothetical protein
LALNLKQLINLRLCEYFFYSENKSESSRKFGGV